MAIKKLKKELQAVGKWIIIKAVKKEKDNKAGIIIPFEDKELKQRASTDRQSYTEYIEVVSVGEEVEKVKVGDKILLSGHVFNYRIMMNHIFSGEEYPENEEYYWAEEKDVVCKTLGI